MLDVIQGNVELVIHEFYSLFSGVISSQSLHMKSLVGSVLCGVRTGLVMSKYP